MILVVLRHGTGPNAWDSLTVTLYSTLVQSLAARLLCSAAVPAMQLGLSTRLTVEGQNTSVQWVLGSTVIHEVCFTARISPFTAIVVPMPQ